jgi:arylsulfatase A-like enzyme
MIQALKGAGIYDDTLFIVTAKHGQSPINPVKTNKPGHFADLVATLPDAGTNPTAIAIANANACSTGPCGFVQDDDIALIWLQDQSQTQAVADYLNANAGALFIDEVMAGAGLTIKFNSPLKDPATPDIIVQPIYGTVYTGSKSKNAEHGGFSFADTNVGLIVSNPELRRRVVKSPVATSQVAASIIRALGYDPNALDAVRKEGTRVLPFLFGEGRDAVGAAAGARLQERISCPPPQRRALRRRGGESGLQGRGKRRPMSSASALGRPNSRKAESRTFSTSMAELSACAFRRIQI